MILPVAATALNKFRIFVVSTMTLKKLYRPVVVNVKLLQMVCNSTNFKCHSWNNTVNISEGLPC